MTSDEMNKPAQDPLAGDPVTTGSPGGGSFPCHLLFETSRDSILLFALPADGPPVIIEVNPEALKLLGYTRGELIGKPVSFLEPGPSVLEEKIRRTVGDNACIAEIIRLKKDGTVLTVETSVNAIRDGDKRFALCIERDITERKKMEELSLKRAAISEAQLNSSIDGILIVDEAGRKVLQNLRAVELWKIPKDVAENTDDASQVRHVMNMMRDPEQFVAKVKHLYAHPEEISHDEVELTDGRTFDRYSAPVPGKSGENYGRIWMFRDITERKLADKERETMQEQLLQARKMESVGRLAGGVAHDFNNLLTAITGYAGVLQKSLSGDEQKLGDVREILNAAERAAGLTMQLLAFSRKQIIHPETLDLNAAVTGIVNMLKRLIGEDIKLETQLAENACTALVDSGQMDQLLVNLAINARDAMRKGGKLTVKTALVSPADEFYAAHPFQARGQFVCLAVSDTGSGMSPTVKEHLFEPFFTTKKRGEGTGMGLSTVFGIVKQSGGEIEVESDPGQGTSFRIYLPRAVRTLPHKASPGGAPMKGSETILLVEDEESLRRFGERLLCSMGYTVVSAGNGEQALQAAERGGKPFDLLLTDVVMPGMNGKETATELERRGLVRKTLYMSGYTDDVIAKHGVLEEGTAFINKPFTADALSAKLREVLDGPPEQAKA